MQCVPAAPTPKTDAAGRLVDVSVNQQMHNRPTEHQRGLALMEILHLSLVVPVADFTYDKCIDLHDSQVKPMTSEESSTSHWA